MFRGFKHSDQLLPVDYPQVGVRYHVAWAKRGCVWICKNIDFENNIITLVTPRTKKIILVNLSDLRHTRKSQLKIQQSKS